MRQKGGRGAAATHGEPLRTHSRSGLALSRRHQGHCNEILRGRWERESEGAGKRQKKEEEAIRHVHAKGCYTDIHVQFKNHTRGSYSQEGRTERNLNDQIN